MGDSLKDQLLALGLARARPEKPAAPRTNKADAAAKAHGQGKAAGRGREHPRDGRHSGPRPPAPSAGRNPEPSLGEAWRLREAEAVATKEAEKARKQLEDQRRRELNQRVQEMVEGQALNDPQAELKRNFLFKNRIRSVTVNAGQLRQLNAGELGLVFLRGGYIIVPTALAEAVREIAPDHVPELAGNPDQGPPGEEEFPVPDDLIW